MTLPVATALERRDRFWPAVSVSLAVHVGLVAWALARTPPMPDLEQTPLRARLVRLGEKRPETYLPRKVEPPAAPAPAPVVAPPVPEVAAAPATAASRPGTSPAPASAPSRRSTGAAGGLASALSRVRREVAQEEQAWGDPEGDPAGDSEVGEGDRYLALVERALRASYDVPSTISEQERIHLKALVSLTVEPDGRISAWRFEERSGNPAFDAALERTLRATPRPPPPDDRRESYRRTGVQVMFKI